MAVDAFGNLGRFLRSVLPVGGAAVGTKLTTKFDMALGKRQGTGFGSAGSHILDKG